MVTRTEYMERAQIRVISQKEMECRKTECAKWQICFHGKAHIETSDCKNICRSHGKKCTEQGIIGTWSG